jgi:hypothetical protein
MGDIQRMGNSHLTLTLPQTRFLSLWILVALATSWRYASATTILDLRPMGAILTLIACIILVAQIWRSLRNLLDRGVTIPRHQKLIGHWFSLLMFLPFCFQFRMGASKAESFTFYYGGGITGITAVAGGLAIFLYETRQNIEYFIAKYRIIPPFASSQEVTIPAFLKKS